MGNIMSFISGRDQTMYTVRSTQTIYKTSYTDRSVQTKVKQMESSAQTSITFSENLTHNNTQEVGSSDVFEETCELCDNSSEKEAVGYCRTCQKKMCLQCCKIHEAIPVSKNHPIVGKADFEKLVKQTSLYTKTLAPAHPPATFSNANSNYRKIGAINISNSEITIFWIPTKTNKTKYVCSLECFDGKSGDCLGKLVDIPSQVKEDLCDVAEPKCNKKAYFVIVQDIPRDNINSKTEVYKYCPEHERDKIRIAFRFCGLSHSVVPFNGGLALSVYIKIGFSAPDWQIRFTDFKGNIIRQICYDDYGKQLFIEPRHLASSHTCDTLFVSDYAQKSVTALDKEGNVLFIFTHTLLENPLGISCDEENNVYVACKTTVVQVHKDGNKCRSILRTAGHPYIHIVDVCYNPVSRQLAVAESLPRATIFNFL